MALAGHNAVISIATGASVTYVTMTGMSQLTVDDAKDMFDITDFVDSNIRRRITGLQDFGLSMSGNCEMNDAGYLRLTAAHRAESLIYVRVLYNGVAGFMNAFVVESKNTSSSVDGKVDLEVSLKSSGDIDLVEI